MNTKLTLNAIEALIESLADQSHVERLKAYTAIKMLLEELRKYADSEEQGGNPIPNANIYLNEMDMPLKGYVELENYGHRKDQYIVWLNTGIRKLKSFHCFNTEE
jgi:hypothetical protein